MEDDELRARLARIERALALLLKERREEDAKKDEYRRGYLSGYSRARYHSKTGKPYERVTALRSREWETRPGP